MAHHGKKYIDAAKLVDRMKDYSPAEAVDLLNQVLAKNGYTALQDGRTLTVVTKDEARKRDTPVRTGSDPAGIPRSARTIAQAACSM